MQMAIKDFRDDMADPINRAAYSGERIILTRKGKGVAALVGMDDLALLEELENRSDLKAALEARKEQGGVSLERIKARLSQR